MVNWKAGRRDDTHTLVSSAGDQYRYRFILENALTLDGQVVPLEVGQRMVLGIEAAELAQRAAVLEQVVEHHLHQRAVAHAALGLQQLHELLDQYPGEVIRLLLLSAQYRQPLDFTPEGLAQAKGTLDRWYGLLRGKGLEEKPIPAPVEDALSDDLNTPLAISALHQLRDPSELKAGAAALGLLQHDPEAWFRWTPATAAAGPSDAEIEAAIAENKQSHAAQSSTAPTRAWPGLVFSIDDNEEEGDTAGPEAVH